MVLKECKHIPAWSFKFILIGALYFSQGIPNGFFRHTVPVVFRENGMSLEKIAIFYPALYAPWILKFIWSILMERFYLEKQGKYRSWIIPLQVLTAGGLVAVANWQFGTAISVFVLCVGLINIFSSMQDVATDGQAVELLDYKDRGFGNAVQVGTFWIGYVLGGGVILMLMGSLGWSVCLTMMSIITLIATIPIISLRVDRSKHSKKSFSLLSFFRQPGVILVLGLVAFYRLADGFIRSLLPAMLKDWGMKIEEIGFLLGVAAPIAALCGALTSVFFINRLGRLKALLVFGALQLVSVSGYIFLCKESVTELTKVIPFLVIDHFVSGLTTVALFSIMMDWSRKQHGGTDYTCMDCMGVFSMMIGASASYLLAYHGGYGSSFLVAIPLIFTSLIVVYIFHRKILKIGYWEKLSA